MPVLSTRNSTLPALISLIAFAMSSGHRSGLRVRHQPARPEDLAELADRTHHVGRRHDRIEVRPPPWIFSTSSSPPMKSAPASWASFCLSPRQSRARACSCRDRAEARPCREPSDRRASDRRQGEARARRFRRTLQTSTFCIRGIASSIVCGRARDLLPRGSDFLASLTHALTSVVLGRFVLFRNLSTFLFDSMLNGLGVAEC